MEIENDHEYFNIVIENMKRLLSVKSDRQLAFALDVLPASFANSKKRALIPCEKIIQVAIKRKFNLNEIFGNIIIENQTFINANTETNLINNNDLINIKLLDSKNDFIRVPLFTRNESDNYKAYIHNKKDIYVININERNIENGKFYLLKGNDVFYVRYIMIDFDGNYTLKDEQNISEKVNKEVLENIEIIGKIEAAFNKNMSQI